MPKLNRAAFVRGYAQRSGLPDKWAVLGFIQIEGDYLLALPCGCGEESCEGWAMVSPSSVNAHLEMYAPESISAPFRDFVSADD